MWRLASILLVLSACRGSARPLDASVPLPPDAGVDLSAIPPDDTGRQIDAAVFDVATGDVSMLASFFVTSRGGGHGGDLGGLAGADVLCTTLAQAASPILAARTWHAYLSTAAVDARDRIGAGPWYNLRGVLIATSVANLHEESGGKNALTRDTALDELGHVLYGLDPPPGELNEHDILTGSDESGRYLSGDACDDWTLGLGGRARVGHSDRIGGSTDSWNSVHDSDGCAESGADSVRSAGGRGSLYCFAL